MWTKTGNYGQKHEIMDKNFESTYEHLSEPRNVHTIFCKMWTKTWNYGQKFRIYLWIFKWIQKCLYNFLKNVNKNMKLWTNISSLLMNIHEYSSEPRKCGQYCPNLKNNCPHFLGSLECSWMFISRLEMFVHNFMFLSTFSRKLYEHFWIHLNVHK